MKRIPTSTQLGVGRHAPPTRATRPGRSGLALLAAVACLAGCAAPQAPGPSPLELAAESEEIALGTASYAGARQLRGGDWKVDAMLLDYVREVGARVAGASNRPDLPYEFHVLDSANADVWSLPGGKVALSRSLIGRLADEAELAAVLAHEVAHSAAGHQGKRRRTSQFQQNTTVAEATDASHPDYANLAVGAAVRTDRLLRPRHRPSEELEADRLAISALHGAGYDTRAAVALLETELAAFEERDSGAPGNLHANHPPSEERLAAARAVALALAKRDGPGERHVDRFEARTAKLREMAPGYEALEEGARHLSERSWEAALLQADTALAIEPGVARFHALRGAAHAGAERWGTAIEDFDRAIQRDDGYFLWPLQRGRALEAAGFAELAQRDFARSLELLGTVLGHASLGGVAEQRGDATLAAQHYLAIAGTKNRLGRDAARSLARIELSQKPEHYLRVRTGVDDANMLYVEIENRAPIAASGIVVEITQLDVEGRPGRTDRVELDVVIEAGASIAHRTRLGPLYTFEQLNAIRIAVVAAHPN